MSREFDASSPPGPQSDQPWSASDSEGPTLPDIGTFASGPPTADQGEYPPPWPVQLPANAHTEAEGKWRGWRGPVLALLLLSAGVTGGRVWDIVAQVAAPGTASQQVVPPQTPVPALSLPTPTPTPSPTALPSATALPAPDPTAAAAQEGPVWVEASSDVIETNGTTIPAGAAVVAVCVNGPNLQLQDGGLAPASDFKVSDGSSLPACPN